MSQPTDRTPDAANVPARGAAPGFSGGGLGAGRDAAYVVPAGTLPARRLDNWDTSVHGALYRSEFAPKQDGEAGHWWVVSPVLDTARLGPEFAVTEHEDGTISVYPSLVFDRPGQSGFHGYLNRSVWSWGSFEDRRYRDAA